jgi:4-amino-4-deoxy-L-arabinose transferase-like glycosyltransferase
MAQEQLSTPVGRAGLDATAAAPGNRRRQVFSRVAAGPWPLVGILAVQALLCLRLIWSNTAFQDEALYLWAGRLEWAHWLHGASVPDLPAYFSGAPVVYPPLAAVAGQLGGLAAARLLSLCFMLGATALLYAVARQLFGRGPAIAGSATFGTLGSVQFLGAFATFDALTIFLLALASWLALRSGSGGRRGELCLIACAVVMVAADAAKYAGLLWDPVVIALAILTADGAWQSALRRGVRLAAYAGALIAALLAGAGHSYLTGIMTTTLSRPASTVPVSRVLGIGVEWIGGVVVLAVIGAAVLPRRPVNRKILGWVLVAAALLAPADQARIHTSFSLFKHVGYGAWFACIMAGYALAAIARYLSAERETNSNSLSVLLVVLLALFGVALSGTAYAAWPNSARMISELRPVIARTGCPCLIAESDVVHYYLPRQTLHDNLTTVFVLRYRDGSRELSGLPAYGAAIRDGYFRLVEIDAAELPSVYQPVLRALAASHYRLADSTPSNIPGQPFEIWVRISTRRKQLRS